MPILDGLINFVMQKKSAGILAYRKKDGPEVFLVHPGGPFFKKKDEGVWSIPKGEFEETESPLAAARREFIEETGFELMGELIELKPVKQKAGKIVYAWAVETDINEKEIQSNTFTMEWPPRSGKTQEFAEIDKAGWFTISEAKLKINPAQVALIDELIEKLTNES
jgi:predicted NUDIX family NTP pyrophosphohydrolase